MKMTAEFKITFWHWSTTPMTSLILQVMMKIKGQRNFFTDNNANGNLLVKDLGKIQPESIYFSRFEFNFSFPNGIYSWRNSL